MSVRPGPPKQISPRNLYRERWSLPLNVARIPPLEAKALELKADPVQVLRRLPSGMVYEVAGEKFLLAERVFGESPFLLVFGLKPRERADFLESRFDGIPDEVMRSSRSACETTAANLKLPANLHNIEADVTEAVSAGLRLPDGWSLVKAIIKIDIRPGFPSVACDCDVDGPCGYCCDTCDCNSCYNCC